MERRTQLASEEVHADLAIVRRPIASLLIDPENARQHPEPQLRTLARAIATFNVVVPILIDRDLKVLAGHARLEACKRLGWRDVNTISIDHLDPAKARAFALADNRISELGAWNEGQLAVHLKALAAIELDFSIEATGFSMGEIDLKIQGLDGDEPVDDPDEAAVETGPAVAKAGDLWILGRHKVLCASALEQGSYDRLLGEDRAAIVIADPPYNVAIDGNVSNLTGGKARRKHREFAMASGELSEVEFTAFLTTACALMAKASLDGALHYVFMNWRNAFALMAAGRVAYDDLINVCVWVKPGGGMGGLYRSAHEFVLVFKHGRASHQNNVRLGKFGRNRTNIWAYPGSAAARHGEEADLTAPHPTPKPLVMIADALLDASARGDVALDPFLGSGSTLIACERVGRRCRGLEIDPLYVDLTIRRWQRLTGDAAMLDGAGETFDALAAKAQAPS